MRADFSNQLDPDLNDIWDRLGLRTGSAINKMEEGERAARG